MNLNKAKATIAIGILMMSAGCAGKAPANNTDTNTVMPSQTAGVSPVASISETEWTLSKWEDLKVTAPILADERLLSMKEEAFSSVTDSAVAMTKVMFSENGIAANGVGCKIDGNVLKIKEAGVYEISGTLSNGQIVVNAGEENTVQLILNGVSVHNENQSALVCKKTGKVIVTLADGTDNVFSDGTGYVFEDGETEPDATIFSKVDLVFNGSGTLTVNAAYKDAVKCKDALYIDGGVYRITAREDGIIGKDFLCVKNGDFAITCEGDGLKASNDSDEVLGTVMIEDGSFSIQAGKEAVQAENTLFINGGKMVASGRKTMLATNAIFINGGSLFCLGSHSTVQVSLEKFTQYFLSLETEEKAQKGSMVTVWLGEEVLYSVESKEEFSGIMVSSPKMTSGTQVRVDIDGSTIYQGIIS